MAKKKMTDIVVEGLSKSGVVLFHTPDKKPYISFKEGSKRNTLAIYSKEARLCLQKMAYKESKVSLKKHVMDDLIETLAAKALFEGKPKEVHLRVASTDKGIEIDLNDDAGNCVLVGHDGWKITQPKSFFIRPNGMQSLPMPLEGGSVELFERHIKTEKPEDLILIVGFMLMCLNPSGPYPILVIQGEQGSAKTTTMEMIKMLTDPSKGATRGLVRSEHDIYIAAMNNKVMSFDNLSGLKYDISDTFCRIATGGAFSTRKLHTDDSENLIELARPVILNGIDDIATRPDLASRSVVIRLPIISSADRKTKQDVMEAFEAERALLFGVLMDGLASAFSGHLEVSLKDSPRMADFVYWGTAAENILGWPEGVFSKAFEDNQRDAVLNGLSLNPVVMTLRKFLTGLEEDSWTGTATRLLSELEHKLDGNSRPNTWPRNAGALSNALARLSPQLKELGIEVSKDRTSKNRYVILTKLPSFEPLPYEGEEPEGCDFEVFDKDVPSYIPLEDSMTHSTSVSQL